LFSILLFGGLWGITGMIIGVPLFAVLYDISRQLIRFGLSHHNRDDLIVKYRLADTDFT
jgi:predicted PurR-regulated permease PerM